MEDAIYNLEIAVYAVLGSLFLLGFALQLITERYHGDRKIGHVKVVFHRTGFVLALLHVIRSADPEGVSTLPLAFVFILDALCSCTIIGTVGVLVVDFYLVSHSAKSQTAPPWFRILMMIVIGSGCVILITLMSLATAYNMDSYRGAYLLVYGVYTLALALAVFATGYLLRYTVFSQLRKISEVLHERLNKLVIVQLLLFLFMFSIAIQALIDAASSLRHGGELRRLDASHTWLLWSGFMYLAVFLWLSWLPLGCGALDESSVESLQAHLYHAKMSVDTLSSSGRSLSFDRVESTKQAGGFSKFVWTMCCKLSHSARSKKEGRRIASRLVMSYVIAISAMLVLVSIEEVVMLTELSAYQTNQATVAEAGGGRRYPEILAGLALEIANGLALSQDMNATAEQFYLNLELELANFDALKRAPKTAEATKLLNNIPISMLHLCAHDFQNALKTSSVTTDMEIIDSRAECLATITSTTWDAMNQVSLEMAEESEINILGMLKAQYAFLGLTIFICLMQVVFVFVPTVGLVQASLKDSAQQLSNLKAMQTNANRQLNAINRDLDDVVLQKIHSVIAMRQFFEDAVERGWTSYKTYLRLHFYDPHGKRAWQHISTIISRRTQELETISDSIEEGKYGSERQQVAEIMQDHQSRHIQSLQTSGMSEELISTRWRKMSSKFKQTNKVKVQTLEGKIISQVNTIGLARLFGAIMLFETDLTRSLTFLITSGLSRNDKKSVVVLEQSKDPRTTYATMFEEFLRKEHSVENFEFIKAVELFKRVSSIKKNKMGHAIYEKFIANDALQMVNLDSGTKARLDKIFDESKDKEIPEWIFAEAETVILELMATDSYKRFLLTSQSKKMISQLQQFQTELSTVLNPLTTFTTTLREFTVQHSLEAVKAGQFELAQKIYLEGMRMFDDIIPVCSLDAEAFISSCQLEELKIQELWAQQDWKAAEARKDRLQEVIRKLKANWVKEIVTAVDKHLSQRTLTGAIVPALLKLDVFRKLEKIRKIQEFGERKVEDGDGGGSTHSEGSTHGSSTRDSKYSTNNSDKQQPKPHRHGKTAAAAGGGGGRSGSGGSGGSGTTGSGTTGSGRTPGGTTGGTPVGTRSGVVGIGWGSGSGDESDIPAPSAYSSIMEKKKEKERGQKDRKEKDKKEQEPRERKREVDDDGVEMADLADASRRSFTLLGMSLHGDGRGEMGGVGVVGGGGSPDPIIASSRATSPGGSPLLPEESDDGRFPPVERRKTPQQLQRHSRKLSSDILKEGLAVMEAGWLADMHGGSTGAVTGGRGGVRPSGGYLSASNPEGLNDSRGAPVDFLENPLSQAGHSSDEDVGSGD